jgi:hypothetical protein
VEAWQAKRSRAFEKGVAGGYGYLISNNAIHSLEADASRARGRKKPHRLRILERHQKQGSKRPP